MNVPKLRFKEFSDEWQVMKISNISSGITKGTTPKKYSDSGINFIKVENIHDNTITNINSYISTNTHNGKLKRSILKENDILFSIAGALGRTAIVKKDILPANTNQACSIIRLDNPDEINLNYLINRLNNTDIKNYIFKCQSVGAQPNLSLEQVNNILISYPSKTEQRKIGKLLSIIDKKIELQSKKIEALKLFKSGQIVKKIKSLDGKEVELKKFGYFISSNSIGKEKITISGVPLILYGDLYTKYSEEITKINQYIKDNEKYIKSEINDLLFPTSTTVDAISLISPSVINIANVVYGGDLLIFKTISSNVNPKFLSYQINHFKRKEFAKKAQGTTIIHIHANDLLSSKVKIPDLNTQILIAHFGNKINKKIELETLKLNKLKSLKKGLMQNLFV